MAKQTFTTGQVLSAAQMTSLQANDYNQTVSAKVASYTLVAADAGTTVTMSNVAATTITVNTGLFSAGDTLRITNIGAGVCTVTAGTATVSTSGVLTLAQYASGILYFTSTGVAIFFGSAAAASSGGMTVIASGSLSGTQVSLTSIAGTYTNLILVVRDFYFAAAAQFRCQLNTNTGSVYWNATRENDHSNATVTNAAGLQTSLIRLSASLNVNNADNNNVAIIQINDYAGSTSNKLLEIASAFIDGSTNRISATNNAVFNNTTAITSIQIFPDSTTFSGGTYILYGVS